MIVVYLFVLKLQNMTEGMQELETFDLSRVVGKQRDYRRMKRDLAECQHELQATPQPPTPHPRTYTLAFNLNVSLKEHTSKITELNLLYLS